MKTKEAIKFLSGHIRLGHWSDCAVYDDPAFKSKKCNCGFWGNLQKVIELLQNSEKYEQMCKDVEEFIGSSDITLSEFMNIKQKYFPKPKTMKEKINDIMTAVRDSYAYLDRPNSGERDKIIDMLVELRDEESGGSD